MIVAITDKCMFIGFSILKRKKLTWVPIHEYWRDMVDRTKKHTSFSDVNRKRENSKTLLENKFYHIKYSMQL